MCPFLWTNSRSDQMMELKLPNFHKSCPNSSHSSFAQVVTFFQIVQYLRRQIFGLLLAKTISKRPLKSCPIWSRCLTHFFLRSPSDSGSRLDCSSFASSIFSLFFAPNPHWPNHIKNISSVILRYADFKHSDWLLKTF